MLIEVSSKHAETISSLFPTCWYIFFEGPFRGKTWSHVLENAKTSAFLKKSLIWPRPSYVQTSRMSFAFFWTMFGTSHIKADLTILIFTSFSINFLPTQGTFMMECLTGTSITTSKCDRLACILSVHIFIGHIQVSRFCKFNICN